MRTPTTTELDLPAWAQVTEKRRQHIQRVTALLNEWAARLSLPPEEAIAWHDAGRLHDALRDAPEDVRQRQLEVHHLAAHAPGS